MTASRGAPPAPAAPIARMAIAVLALVGLFVAGYLLLHRLGLVGQLLCGAGGSCETVQSSKWATQLGVPVPIFGVVGYVVLFALALVGLQPNLAGDRRVSLLLLVLSGGAVLYTGYLTYLEAFVIHAWCRYCVASAIAIVLIFLLSILDLARSSNRPWPGEPA